MQTFGQNMTQVRLSFDYQFIFCLLPVVITFVQGNDGKEQAIIGIYMSHLHDKKENKIFNYKIRISRNNSNFGMRQTVMVNVHLS